MIELIGAIDEQLTAASYQPPKSNARSSPLGRRAFRLALDSTVLDDEVATQDTVTQLIAEIRRVARDGARRRRGNRRALLGHDYRDQGKPAIAWDDPDDRARLVDAMVGDAHRLLGHLLDAGAQRAPRLRR